MGLCFYHRRDHAACRRLDRVIRGRDPLLFTVFNQGLQRYEIWRRNRDGDGLVLRIEGPFGEFIHPDYFGQRALQLLHQMDRDPREVAREIEAHNDRLAERSWDRMAEECAEIGGYFRQAVAQEDVSGFCRFGAEDVLRGFQERWV